MLPSVGDKNAFAGICTLSEYFPSSFVIFCDQTTFSFEFRSTYFSLVSFSSFAVIVTVKCCKRSQAFGFANVWRMSFKLGRQRLWCDEQLGRNRMANRDSGDEKSHFTLMFWVQRRHYKYVWNEYKIAAFALTLLPKCKISHNFLQSLFFAHFEICCHTSDWTFDVGVCLVWDSKRTSATSHIAFHGNLCTYRVGL